MAEPTWRRYYDSDPQVIGQSLAVPVGVLMRSVFVGVSATRPTAMIPVSVLMVCMALLASALPALRAARVDPTVALRDE